MNILPTAIEEKINRVDRQRSLYIGISTGVLAVWSFYRLIWMVYIGMTFGWFFGRWHSRWCCGVRSAPSAAVASFGFLTRYRKGS